MGDRGFLQTEYFDMKFVYELNLGIPVAELRQWVQDCRKWVNLNEIHLERSDTLCKEDVDAYLEYLTSKAEEEMDLAIAEDIARDMTPVQIFPVQTPVQRVVEHATQSVISTATVALSEVVKLMTDLPGKTGEAGERDVKEIRQLLDITAECCGQLASTFHLQYCSGCGTHNNSVGIF